MFYEVLQQQCLVSDKTGDIQWVFDAISVGMNRGVLRRRWFSFYGNKICKLWIVEKRGRFFTTHIYANWSYLKFILFWLKMSGEVKWRRVEYRSSIRVTEWQGEANLEPQSILITHGRRRASSVAQALAFVARGLSGQDVQESSDNFSGNGNWNRAVTETSPGDDWMMAQRRAVVGAIRVYHI